MSFTTRESETVATADPPRTREAMETASSQAGEVVHEAKEQLHTLVDKAKNEVHAQSREKGQELARSMQRLAGQLGALADGRPQDAGELPRYLTSTQARLRSMADHVQTGGLQAVGQQTSTFARRRPGLYLLAAVGTGFAVGRVVKMGNAGTGSQRSHPADHNGRPQQQSAIAPTWTANMTTDPSAHTAARWES